MAENNKKESIDSNIKIIDSNIRVGSLVCLKTTDFELKIKGKIDIIDLKSPVMVVIEIVQEKKNQEKNSNLYNSSTGKLTNFERQVKVKCMWYSVSEGEFQKEQWFPIELLNSIEVEPNKLEFELGNIVALRTYLIKSLQKEDKVIKGNSKSLGKNNSTDKFSDFRPPIMVVSEIVYEQKSLPLYFKDTGERLREITEEDYIKCLFFNSKKQKFTTEVFIAEALTVIS